MARQKRQHAPLTHADGAATERVGTGVEVGDRVRAKTTARTGEVTHIAHDGERQHVTVTYDHEPQDDYLTMPARDGAELPRELVDPVDEHGATIRST